ncbi:uncharacterized protein L969DRAFT_91312 [Mixia osmundae IAM 14324]|uniref:Hydroxysteroid dehydrogenase-like protein 2 n=1 Tax=Mixia osmundae (strain CBS 9802 / IAM 14324 / JCM 22182 / KY 12970) TaxID=764103 RepID=G7E4M9_MIXOS|nr:uncharacterized protein L969DRAFT_91312 [Mixia osmundae IAM 14324]KEI41831.1 hypothetical protein L969DRAFT_91312 [Mixia osmundae IAM 14324]GAA97789.1 hypothetical protein E5Q_04468 [Mixia osmundae IAM 14324]
MTSLKGKTAFISGGSRGIGLAIGIALGQHGANVVIAAKTASTNPKLPGTIYTAAAAIEEAGGRALAVQMDIRDAQAVEAAINKTVDTFGSLDIVINNASAISLTSTLETTPKVFDLVHGVDARGTWLVSKAALPYLIKSAKQGRNPHILTLSPQLRDNITKEEFAGRTAYAMAKYGMSLAALGLSGELEQYGIASNCLWPYTSISTEAMRFIAGAKSREISRTPEIMADAAISMLQKPAEKFTSRFEIDEVYLRKEHGYTTRDFRKYAQVPDDELILDFFIPQWQHDELAVLRANDTTLAGQAKL